MLCVGYCPHTATVYSRVTVKGLLCPFSEYFPTVTEWGQYPSYAVRGLLEFGDERLVLLVLESFLGRSLRFGVCGLRQVF